MSTLRLGCDIHQAVVDFAEAGRAFALAVVLRDSGSTPRKAGTKAVIDSSGAILGTIGGGLLESQAQRLAVEAIRAHEPVVFDFKFAGASAIEDRPICGGNMRILIDPTAAEQRAAYAQAAKAARLRERGVLATNISAADRPKVTAQWFAPGTMPTDAEFPAGEAIRSASSSGTPQVTWHEVQWHGKRVELLIEALAPAPLLVIVGGGHVGQALARHASLVGFEVVVIEDRPQFADASRHPAEVAVRCGDIADELARLPINRDTYIALVGRGHLLDAKALAACIDKSAAYIGMMGSRRKVALLRKEFIESGRATEEQWNRVHAPIGLDIGAQTVPEIAASIVAQLIAVWRKGTAARFPL
jgi:xanthine dehydrogenase accessory factor